MRLSIIVALDHNWLIGCHGQIPWRLPRDMANFRRLTWGRPVIMGRKTWESLPALLIGRTNIVLSRTVSDLLPDAHAVSCRTEALSIAASTDATEAFVIGGAQIYRAFLPSVSRVYLTLVDGDFVGDAFFPHRLIPNPSWVITDMEHWPADSRNPHDASFMVLERDLEKIQN